MIMDFKGINWVGNLYQKFEAMCLEVEETMYQDTVKYVENQVNTVGASVKKFYSDVMQDLSPCSVDPVKAQMAGASVKLFQPDELQDMPPYAIDSVKVVASNLPLEQHADSAFYKKPKGGVEEEATMADVEPSTENPNMIANVFKGTKGNPIRKKKSPPFEVSRVTTTLPTDLSTASAVYEQAYENHEGAVDQIDTASTTASVEPEEYDPEKGKNCTEIVDVTECVADASIDSPSTDKIFLVESVGSRGMELRFSPNGCSSEESNGKPVNAGLESMTGSSVIRLTLEGESAQEVSMSYPEKLENLGAESTESYGVIMPGVDPVELLDKVKLEESCVMVYADKSCLVSQRESKRRSYKKKIRDTFSTKSKSDRKQEYEQLAVQYREIDTASKQQSADSMMPHLTMVSDRHKLEAHDFFESEWELL
ncbi:uncharacterized protein LOC131149681 isoform X2 [Malania oleifera]|uniref:uncharacterized protein LOC131149681 isoform X2 n=1 Tax=Malania oleifera TaxID=397392 RepID=UPI0025AE25B3|nr:uncharacterized protein LOC131149681 isoform X2 [Malania oleifera]XP_057956325.1 uncharacterized protein LOC131149681 isoform X2 [Malania oleifera]